MTVSGQLSVENYACSLQNVYTFGPTFRAENSNTTKHLAEFWMIEPEISFADINDDMDLAEDFLKFIIKYCLQNNKADLEFFSERIKPGNIDYIRKILETPFQRVDYAEACEKLQQAIKDGVKFENYDNKIEFGYDFA